MRPRLMSDYEVTLVNDNSTSPLLSPTAIVTNNFPSVRATTSLPVADTSHRC